MMFGLCLRDAARREAKHQQESGLDGSHKHCYRTSDFWENLADLGTSVCARVSVCRSR
jgi:hypothetical protein